MVVPPFFPRQPQGETNKKIKGQAILIRTESLARPKNVKIFEKNILNKAMPIFTVDYCFPS